jgi:Major tropism determinant N-terminal domain
MTTAVQVQYRRGTASQVASFTGAAGEMVVDTTNNRLVVQDGSTAGGWPQDLAVRTAINNANYTTLATDRIVAFTALSAPRTVSLIASASYPVGAVLKVVDESGSCSATDAITISPSGSDTINGGSSATIWAAYGFIELESSGGGKWTVLAANGAAVAFNATTLSLARHAVSDANYTVASGISTVAYTAITAARTVTLPASSSFNPGQQILIVDESGSCSSSKAISVNRAGSDTIAGATSLTLNQAYAYVALESNASGNWTVVDQGPQVNALNNLTGQITLAATDGLSISASGSTIAMGGPGGMVNKFRNGTMDVWQRGTSPSLTAATSGSQYTADGWQVNWTASSSAAPTISQAGGRLLTKSSLEITGATNITDVQVQQRIESLVAAAFCSQNVTVQAQVYNNTGASITPTLTVKRPSTQDGWSGTVSTDVNAASLQACANGAWTQVAYTFSANSASYNGLEIIVDFGNNFGSSSKDIQITECDIRVTPGATAGQTNSNPPPPELRPVAIETLFCQRYLYVIAPGATDALISEVGLAYGAGAAVCPVGYPATMRSAPALAISAAGDFAPATSTAGVAADFTSVTLNSNSTTSLGLLNGSGSSGLTAGNATFFLATDTSAKLTFSAEL